MSDLKRIGYTGVFVLLFLSVLGYSILQVETEPDVVIIPIAEYTPIQDVAFVEQLRENRKPDQELFDVYRDLIVIDVHNHDAGSGGTLQRWKQFGIDRMVLFGSVSDPNAQFTDLMAWEHYQREPSAVYPSFSGFPIYEEEGLDIIRHNLEQGYLNIGETYAASTYAPIANRIKWKGRHPYDGNLPQIYELAAEYGTPILLHIDPPFGAMINYFETALRRHPETIFIFAHGNAYNTPSNLEALLERAPDNLYIDFFAGYTAYNPISWYTLEDYVPLIEKYADRFFLSTDSATGILTREAALAMYETIDLLSAEAVLKVSHQNYERLVEQQLPTETQIKKIRELAAVLGESGTYHLNKRMANELIFEFERRILELNN